MKPMASLFSTQGRRVALITLDAFLAITAIAGGVGLLGGGLAPPLEMLAGSPFSTFFIPGLALLVLVGGSALLATVLLIARHRWGAPLAGIAGLMITGFEIVEVLVIGLPPGLARNLQLFYFGYGLVLVALAVANWMIERRGKVGEIRHSPAH